MDLPELANSWYGLAFVGMIVVFLIWRSWQRKEGPLPGSALSSAKPRPAAAPPSPGKTMIATLGRDLGTGNECLAECMQCAASMVFFLPKEQIRGSRPQAIAKFNCPACGFLHYATTSVGNRATLSTHCELRGDGMFLGRVAPLDVTPREEASFSGGRGCARFELLVIGTGPDGHARLLTEKDVQRLRENLRNA